VTKLRLNVMNSERETTESSRLESSDYATDTYYYRARYYDAANGRFVSEDPMGLGPFLDSVNLYAYVKNSATNYIDQFGLYKLKPESPSLGDRWIVF
jgi:RHS repeat-associated protein